MNRCPQQVLHFPRVSRLALAFAASLLLSTFAASPSSAQSQVQTQNENLQVGGRHFPNGTLRGKMNFGVFPEVVLDGRAERLAPGVRIRNTQNIGVLPASLTGQFLAVNYRRDAAGLVHEVWILSPQEASTERASADGKPFLNFWPFTSRADNEGR